MPKTKRDRSSLPATALLLCLSAAGIAGCGDRVLETGFGWDYVFQDVKEPAPSPIRRIGTGEGQEYPVLGSVPARPVPPISPATRDLLLDRLAAANRSADVAGKVLEEDAPVLPPPEERPTGVLKPDPLDAAAEPTGNADAAVPAAGTP